MNLFDLLAILITLSALFSYINHRHMRLPTGIGLILIAISLSLALTFLAHFGIEVDEQARSIVSSIDLSRALLGGMLSFLLFAGALHVDLGHLLANKWTIAILATFGVTVSALLIGLVLWWLVGFFGFQIPFLYCFLFGALISPTDPVAVLSILKSPEARPSLEAKICGESLFNDGIGVVLFALLFESLQSPNGLQATDFLFLFVKEAGGGLIMGLLGGYICYRMLKSVDGYKVEVLITLGLVTGGYAAAMHLHTSGPIFVVVSGLMIGNRGRRLAMSENTRQHLDNFWEMVDEVLNAVLFVLIGLEVLTLQLNLNIILLSLLVIPTVLATRFFTVSIPVSFMRLFRDFSPGAIRILTWGGLRGGISVALALSLPNGPERDLLLPLTYCVVVFAIVVQGLTIGPLIRRIENQHNS